MSVNNKPPTRATGSLLERAAQVYGFGEALGVGAPVRYAKAADAAAVLPVQAQPIPEFDPAPPSIMPARAVTIDLAMLSKAGFIVPGAAPTGLSEEFRLVKRQLLIAANSSQKSNQVSNGRMILVCSAQPNEGKTFSSVNLAMSLATERDLEVLLVDADVAKPEILSTLGIEGGAGLMDALADRHVDVETLIMPTNIKGLSVLSAGRQTMNDTELLSSERTEEVLGGLVARNPRRIVVFDSAPVLAASPASVLAHHVGQVVLVVRADQTSESDVHDAVNLLDGCAHIQLMLNGVNYFGNTRKFGSYYGFGE
jgi:protein-tyrosine kinase